jgi:hypothetical protein
MRSLSSHTDLYWLGNTTADKGDPEGKDVQTGLDDQIG